MTSHSDRKDFMDEKCRAWEIVEKALWPISYVRDDNYVSRPHDSIWAWYYTRNETIDIYGNPRGYFI